VYLKHLDIQGFKTFAERTQILFTPGITCVIGPNGSGKSNIADAILWVLGENNVRSLRGSTAQDIIFAGNERRRAVGLAEVSLTIDNTQSILPLDFAEITVTRRLYRSGESEFFINKVACRLRDIYELFLDTGVGRDAYSMVNQGQIDQILSVRAEDRRAIFEEAAGIKKYRVRKREAERKLDNTRQNLLRVTDIISEIEGRLGPLQRQASAAGRYRELAGKLRGLENAWYGQRIRRLTVEREGLAKLVADLKEERERLEAELKGAQDTEAQGREALRLLDERAEVLRRTESDSMQRVAAAQAEKARAEERSGEVQRRLRALEKELDELGGRIQDQVQRAENNAREEAALKKEVDGLRTALAAAQASAAEKARAHEKAVQELESQRQAWLARARRVAGLEAGLESARSRIASLESDAKRAAAAVREAEEELRRLTEERDRHLASAASQKEVAGSLSGELDRIRTGVRETEKDLQEKRAASETAARTLSQQSARLQALTDLGERGEGAAQGAKLLMAGVRKGEIAGE
jgi:chromosome segregation protein